MGTRFRLRPLSNDIRQRHYSWEDPANRWSELGVSSGLDYLTAMLQGKAPKSPIAIALRLTLTEVSEGRVVYLGQPGEDFTNDVGSIQGGWVAALIDAAIGSAVHSALPRGVQYTTLELKVNYVRAMTIKSGQMRCIANTIHIGRTTGTAQARVEDTAGKLYAHATTTCLILPAL